MSSKRLYYALIAAIILLFFGLIFGAYTVNKQMTARATKLTALKAKSAALAQEQILLKKAKKDIQTYSELKKITQAIVPEDKSQAEAVREIVKIANENEISIAAITFPASTLGTGPAGAPTSNASATATPASSASNSKKSALSQLTPVKNIPGVYQLLITIESDPEQPVRYDRFINFLSDLENNRRTSQVNTITLQPDKENPALLSFTLTLNGYVKP